MATPAPCRRSYTLLYKNQPSRCICLASMAKNYSADSNVVNSQGQPFLTPSYRMVWCA